MDLIFRTNDSIDEVYFVVAYDSLVHVSVLWYKRNNRLSSREIYGKMNILWIRIRFFFMGMGVLSIRSNNKTKIWDK